MADRRYSDRRPRHRRSHVRSRLRARRRDRRRRRGDRPRGRGHVAVGPERRPSARSRSSRHVARRDHGRAPTPVRDLARRARHRVEAGTRGADGRRPRQGRRPPCRSCNQSPTLPATNMTTLHTIDPTSDPSWSELMRSPRGSAFGAPPWFTAIVDSYGFDLHANVLRDDSGATCAGIAYAELDDFLGHRIVSVPFCDYLDPVIEDAAQWHQLVDPLLERGLPFQLKVLDAEAPRADTRFAHVDELAYHCTNLERSEDELLAAFNRHAAPEHPLRRAQRRDGSVRHRPRRRPAVPRAPPAHAQAQALAPGPAGLVLREHLEAVRAHRRRCHRLRRARGRRDRIGVLPRVGRRLVLQVQRVGLRTIGRASEREAGLGEHAARDRAAAA